VSFVRLTFVADPDDASDADGEDEDAAAEDADDATQAEAPALAKTGVESLQVVTIGVAMVLAGLMVLHTSRREE